MSETGAGNEVPDGWTREEVIGGMDTVGSFGIPDEYLGIGGGFKCNPCQHFVPIESINDDTCPMCGTSGMIGTVIMGTQQIIALYPEGWFDDNTPSNKS